ncbi:MAG: glucose PTS transporter subunit IIA [Metamycoplasmataceae bacterium]
MSFNFSKIKNHKMAGEIKNKLSNGKHKGKVKSFLSQLSRGLMLPIAILPIAGLLLGIGGAIGANVQSEIGQVFADIFKGMSEVVFSNLPLLFCIAITITFSKDKGASGFCAALAYLVFSSTQLAFIQFEGNNVVSILWFHKEVIGITTKTLGMTTLNTSIFGGIIVGGLTSYIYNNISVVKLPTGLDFFSGIRLVPIVLIPVMFVLSLIFLVFWPWVGLGITKMGEGIQFAPYGTGGLLYGILGRALMPFGLHHIPIVLAFQTPFGGVLTLETLTNGLQAANLDPVIQARILEAFNSFSGGGSIDGDQNIWNFINSLPYNTLGDIQIFEWFYKYTGVYAGRFTQDYPTYLGVCMGIGGAMILAAEVKNRRNVSLVIGSAMLVAFLTGITEPLEFTFLFCAPWLYFLIYVPLSGFSYMFMELMNAHVGVGFARGFIDLIIYGAIPVAKGTNFYWAFVLAAAEGLFAFFTFWILIKKFDLATPGRKDNPMTLINKQNYNEAKTKNKDERIDEIIKKLGGFNNLVDVSACATRLRVTVNDAESITGDDFVPLGSKGFIKKDNSLQVIFGGEASIISDKINDLIKGGHTSSNEDNYQYEDKQNNEEGNIPQTFNIFAPFDGEIVYLNEVPDDLFSSGALGSGIAIKPSSSQIYSPINGKLANVFHTKHAYTFRSSDGTEILLHLGIDTVSEAEKIFDSNIDLGEVTKDKLIASMDLNEMEKCKSTISPIVVPELSPTRQITIHHYNGDKVKAGDIIMTIE